VNSLPIISLSGPVSICNYSTGNLYSTNPGKINYVWSIPAGATITSGGTSSDYTVTLTWTSAGTKVIGVNYTDPATGCSAASFKQMTVTVKPAPVPVINGSSTVCVNAVTVYSTTPFQMNYEWALSSSGTIVTGQATKTVTVKWSSTGAQWISLNYTGLNGCPAAGPTIKNVTVNSCTKSNLILTDSTNPFNVINSIGDESDSIGLTIYPNPNDGTFTAILSVQKADNYTLQIYSNLGVKVYELNDLQVTGIVNQKIDMSYAADGMYNLILTNKEKSIQKRVIIMK
jgi:hypothetical protein